MHTYVFIYISIAKKALKNKKVDKIALKIYIARNNVFYFRKQYGFRGSLKKK